MKREIIITNDGSVQGISEIPQFIQKRYKTAWETKQKDIIDMSADRGKFICQSQSLNLFVESPNYKVLSSMHFYGLRLQTMHLFHLPLLNHHVPCDLNVNIL